MNNSLVLSAIFDQFPDMQGDDEFILFKQFFTARNISVLKNWMNQANNNMSKKNPAKVNDQIHKGKELYFNRSFEKSLKKFNMALIYAQFGSKLYIKALCSRSAAFLMLELYEECLADIKLLEAFNECKLEHKIRRLKCYFQMNMMEKFEKEKMELSGKDLEIITSYQKTNKPKEYHKFKITLPEVHNEKFLNASDKVKLEYKGIWQRDVVTTVDVKAGDVLFVEKPFVAVSAPREIQDLIIFICYECLQIGSYMIPCKSCVYCFYCTEECRDKSWESCHKYECNGMHMFNATGGTLLGLKSAVKGIKSNFKFYDHDHEECTKKFGDAEDNYMYFNSLIPNTSNCPAKEFLVGAAVIVLHLKEKTSFFQDLEMKLDRPDAIDFIGGLLTRHLMQIYLNSSSIINYELKYNLNDKTLLPSSVKKSMDIVDLMMFQSYYGAGVYPSISMMNHSCQPNTNIFYINDVAIVKAVEDIPKGNQVFNCYGMDHRFTDRVERKHAILDRNLFECLCEICLDPSKEFKMVYNHVVCICGNILAEDQGTCNECNRPSITTALLETIPCMYPLTTLDNIDHYVAFWPRLAWTHEFIFDTCKAVAKLLKKQGQYLAAIMYRNKCAEITKVKYGKNSKEYALLLNDICNDNNEIVNKICKMHYPVEEVEIV
ncbi:PREDICTED: SET and MYND domain-containing protein 4-like [Nicrophorus vespilloides]|uniref:Protein-lysine N-methyltransferase SMYD4 n=1 Tax=Nicrophorus vespilloides TaxID=110193 RepID=A0ABM1NDC6_NICVS|nr:PREDICTED: SET and MYND domain-containing protein 4-like [Nicrophorus vespilloides]